MAAFRTDLSLRWKIFKTSRKQEVDDRHVRRTIRAYTLVCAGVGTITRYIVVTLSGLSLSLSSLYKTYCDSGGNRGYAQDRGCAKGRISHNVRVTHPAHHAPLASLPFESPFLLRIETEATPENLLALNRPCGGITHLFFLPRCHLVTSSSLSTRIPASLCLSLPLVISSPTRTCELCLYYDINRG